MVKEEQKSTLEKLENWEIFKWLVISKFLVASLSEVFNTLNLPIVFHSIYFFTKGYISD